MKRPARVFLGYGLCAGLVLTALGAVTVAALDAESGAREVRALARRSTELRLAMWPLDWAAASFLAQQAALDPAAFVAGDRRTDDPEFVMGRFVVHPDGRYAAPMPRFVEKGAPPVPTVSGAVFDGADLRPLVDAARRLADVSSVGQESAALASGAPELIGGPYESRTSLGDVPLPPEGGAASRAASQPFAAGPLNQLRRPPPPPNPQVYQSLQIDENPAQRAQTEFDNRGFNTFETQRLALENTYVNPSAGTPVAPPRVSPFRGVWMVAGGVECLCFVRRFRAAAQSELVHAIWVDGDLFRADLAARVADVLPDARFEPYRGDPEAPDADGDRLASAPVRLTVGPSSVAAIEHSSRGLRAGLGGAWIAVVLALGGGAALLAAAQRLSERRGRFVSAVTHELRTPLTSFRLYADLLADGRVQDEAAKASYLSTLQIESERLSRVVESVLLFARLEGGSGGLRREHVDLADVVHRAEAPLLRRAAESGFEVTIDVDFLRGRIVFVDPQSIEQILVNLVDNACKYADDASVRRIEITAARGRGRDCAVLVRDFGPGIPKGEEQAVFEPFRRSSVHHNGPSPGAGLGLALARALAEAQGGALDVLPAAPGAAFRIRFQAA
jgi:signal transduction histidine kinase